MSIEEIKRVADTYQIPVLDGIKEITSVFGFGITLFAMHNPFFCGQAEGQDYICCEEFFISRMPDNIRHIFEVPTIIALHEIGHIKHKYGRYNYLPVEKPEHVLTSELAANTWLLSQIHLHNVSFFEAISIISIQMSGYLKDFSLCLDVPELRATARLLEIHDKIHWVSE